MSPERREPTKPYYARYRNLTTCVLPFVSYYEIGTEDFDNLLDRAEWLEAEIVRRREIAMGLVEIESGLRRENDRLRAALERIEREVREPTTHQAGRILAEARAALDKPEEAQP